MKRKQSIVREILGEDRVYKIRELVGPGLRWIQRRRYFGHTRFCPCCEASLRRFTPLDQRPEAKCPVCGTLERQRLIWLYMKTKTNLLDGKQKKMLHIAPEPQMSRLVRKAGYIDYLSADKSAPNAMVKMDITDIQFSDNTFDVIYCSHVLEHVPDDKKAMGEFYRVLKPGGWAILQVPIMSDVTFEDPSIVSPDERERVYGQYDHVRRYGPDYKDRLSQAGFLVTVDGFLLELGEQAVKRMGLFRAEDEYVYFCRKQIASES